jgi:CubicO group peptidase (beta-lactamase class C family)
MTSGLVEYTTALDELPDGGTLTNGDVLSFVAKSGLSFPTGSKHEYVNSNYILLSLIVTRASKRPLSAFLREEVWTPLGMSSTVLYDTPGQVVRGRASGYENKRGAWKPSRSDIPVTGDGNVFTNLEDLSRWLLALRDGQVLGAESARVAVTSGRLDSGKRHGYGYGWEISELDGHKEIGHSLAVAVLSNDEGFGAEDVAEEIARRFFASSE